MADTIDIQNTNEWLAEVQAAARDLVNVLKGGIDVGQSGELGDLALLDNATQIPQFAAAALTEMQKYGVGVTSTTQRSLSEIQSLGFTTWSNSDSYSPFSGGCLLTLKNLSGSYGSQLAIGATGGQIKHRGYNNGTFDSTWQTIYTSYNTTVDSNGFIKSASPIFRLANIADDAVGEGFTLDGCGAYNGEAEGVTASHDDVGVYTVSGSLGFADEGWTIEIPQDVNGNRLCFVETEAADDGTITVRIYSRRFDINTAMIVAGDPMDIPDGRWIDLRLSMPDPETVEADEAEDA